MIDATKLLGAPAPEIFSANRSGDGAGVDLVEPITLEQAKRHLRVVFTDDDDDISAMITAARVAAEQRLNRTLVQRQLVARFPAWCEMVLPKPPLISVDSVEYLDADGDLQTLEAFDEYLGAEPVRVALQYGAVSPGLRYRPDAIRVTYTAGYADGDVPAPIVSWMLLVIGTLYEHRATMAAGVQTYSIPDDFMQMLIQPYMVYE